MNCGSVERYVDAVVDQEVDPSTKIAVDEHVSGCSGCRERLEFAVWMKQRLGQEGKLQAPSELRDRVKRALSEEALSEEAETGSLMPRLARFDASWRATAAMAAVALMVFGIGGALQVKGKQSFAAMGPLFEDVVRAHTSPYPAEVARRDLVPAYFADKVDFDAQPVSFVDPGVRFVGARHAEVGGRHAVTFQYETRGRKMTVVAFRPPAHALDGEVAEQEQAGGRSLRYVRVGTHLVPLVEHGGVVYALVGDIAPEDGLRLAREASVH
jgi:anti-sigma factor RsiW